MADDHDSGVDRSLMAAIDVRLAELVAARKLHEDALSRLDHEQTQLGYHPNHAAYIAGGMLHNQGFGVGHILTIAGFHALDWADAMHRLAGHAATDGESRCHFASLRLACETDPMLEITGQALLAEMCQLKSDDIDPYWLRRPKLGLGQAAKAFGVEPRHANGHRGLYVLPIHVLRRGFEGAAKSQSDRRFGALLLPLIETGGDRLAAIGARAFHRDAELRYQEDCRRFAAHQQRNPDRQWRWKPPLSRQGHLAITTARAKQIPLAAARTRGLAANWLDDHDANIRFNRED